MECGLKRPVGNENSPLCPDIGGAGRSFFSPDAESPCISVPGKDIEHPFSGRPYLNHIAESYAFRRYIHELTLFPEIYGNEIVPRHQEGIPGIVRGDLVNFPVLHIGLGDRPPDSRETAQSHRCGDPDIIRTSRNNLHYDIAGQRLVIVQLHSVHLGVPSVPGMQPVIGSEPHISPFILINVQDSVVGEVDIGPDEAVCRHQGTLKQGQYSEDCPHCLRKPGRPSPDSGRK